MTTPPNQQPGEYSHHARAVGPSVAQQFLAGDTSTYLANDFGLGDVTSEMVVEMCAASFVAGQQSLLVVKSFAAEVLAVCDRMDHDYSFLSRKGGGVATPKLGDYADELRALATTPTAPTWHPINSAPKDGTHIVLGWLESPDSAEVGYWSASNEGWEPADDAGPGLHDPDFWMALPPFPSAAEQLDAEGNATSDASTSKKSPFSPDSPPKSIFSDTTPSPPTTPNGPGNCGGLSPMDRREELIKAWGFTHWMPLPEPPTGGAA